METTIVVVEVIEPIELLIERDRCDRCGAQARWAVKLYDSSSPMMFCMHHSREVEDKIKALNPYAILDQREQFQLDEETRNV